MLINFCWVGSNLNITYSIGKTRGNVKLFDWILLSVTVCDCSLISHLPLSQCLNLTLSLRIAEAVAHTKDVRPGHLATPTLCHWKLST